LFTLHILGNSLYSRYSYIYLTNTIFQAAGIRGVTRHPFCQNSRKDLAIEWFSPVGISALPFNASILRTRL